MNLIKNTIGRLFFKRVNEYPEKNSIGWIENNNLKFITNREYKNTVESLALALIKNGLISQDKVAILSNTRKEWHYLDLSVLCSGGVVVPIYHTYLPHEIEYIINHSESKIVIVEDNDLFNNLIKTVDKLNDIKILISIEKLSDSNKEKIPDHIHYFSYQDLISIGTEELISNPDIFEAKINNLHDSDVASIIYTSGTTGEPKGAVITQGAFTHMLLNVKQFTHRSINENDRMLTFLPLSHVFGRCDSLLNLAFGNETVYAESIDKLIDNISIVKPTIMLAVPRIFEKIYEKVNSQIKEGSFIKQSLFEWAMKCANTYFSKIAMDKTPSTAEIIQYKLSYKLVFEKIYNRFGGRIRYFISGGAPLSPEINMFLRNANLTVLEGYGLTETIAPCCLNPFSKQVPGSVGQPMGDVEISFADDNEILIRTKAMFSEYYKNPEKTQEAIDNEGWFHSGDIGQFDSNGYLRITDRKKDIIITSGGKNVAPQKIENLLKLTPHITHSVIIGDKRKFLTALIGIEKENFSKLIESESFEEEFIVENLAKNPKVIDIIDKDIQKTNLELAQYETIKKFYILPIDITTENYLTPSLKLKKKLIIQDYKDEIDAMYKD